MLSGNVGILEFDLEKQSLAVIRVPGDMYGKGNYFQVMRAKGGGLGFLFMSVSDYTAQLWKRKTDCDGVASWELGRTIELDKLLSLNSEDKTPIALSILGFAEQNNAVLIWTVNGIFMIHLESLNFKKLAETTITRPHYHPFESVYTAGLPSMWQVYLYQETLISGVHFHLFVLKFT
uniref:F-box protein AT5G49610-like beta-propeller domain-containing protein n=1 Tax=Aegilops tauschii TaxID=37682 RepID=M8C3I6_AEGTA